MSEPGYRADRRGDERKSETAALLDEYGPP